MVTIRAELPVDVAAREALLNSAFGPKRLRKTSEKLRSGRLPAFAFSALDGNGKLIGTIRLWNVVAGSVGDALLLGPLAVDGSRTCEGIGSSLMKTAIAAARDAGHRAIILVGDHPYYQRFGFDPSLTLKLQLPGPVERGRFLGLELVQGALANAEGRIAASGTKLPRHAAAA
jgi:predicted N-acetyltransferase YhbS